MPTFVTLNGNISDLVGVDFVPRRTKVWLETNISEGFVVDTAGNQIRLGDVRVTPADDGSFTFANLIATNSTGINPTGFQYRVHVEYPLASSNQRASADFGWFSITANSTLSSLVQAQYVPPTWLTSAITTLQGYVDQAETARDEAVAAGPGGGGGSGDVSGPTSVTADRIAVFSGTTGKVIKQASVGVAALAPLASPAFTGTPTLNGSPFPSGGGTSAGAQLRMFPVSDYGAIDGTSDEVQLQAAIDAAAAAGGGIVVVTVAELVCMAPVVPKLGVVIMGGHATRYHVTVNPTSGCKIRVGAGFVGSGLIVANPTSSKGVVLQGIALVGNGQLNSTGGVIHGIRMPDIANMAGEQGWSLERVTIAGFTGSGIYGTVWVWSIVNLHIHNNARYGIETANSDRWNDSKVANVWCYFNKLGGLNWAGGMSALNNFVNSRFERSGQVFNNPENSPTDANWVTTAYGVSITKGQFNNFLNCGTDANTGAGWNIYGAAADVNNNHFTMCIASRDGGGDQTGSGLVTGGWRVGGASDSAGGQTNTFRDCSTVVGTSSDVNPTSGKPRTPQYGLHQLNTLQMMWDGPALAGQVGPILSTAAGTCYGSSVRITELNGDYTVRKNAGTAVVVA